MKTWKLILPTVVVGLGGASLIALERSRPSVPAHVTSEVAVTEPPVPPRQAPVQQELARALAPPAQPPVAEALPPPPPRDPPAPEMAAERLRGDQEFEELTFSYQQDPFDARWARDTSVALKKKLEGERDGSAATVGVEVDCRSSACLAIMTYTNPGDAMGYARRAIDLPSGLNCAILGHLDLPANGEPPHVARVIYHDCRTN